MIKDKKFNISFFRNFFWFAVMVGGWFVVWYMTTLLQSYY